MRCSGIGLRCLAARQSPSVETRIYFRSTADTWKIGQHKQTKEKHMNINEAFPSNYLKASDLNGQSPTVTIEHVEMQELGQGRDKERKLVIGFKGKEKTMICNKTNATTIASLYGPDTESWLNQKITLTAREVEFQGTMVLAIRVSLQKPGSPAAPVKKAAAPAAPQVRHDEVEENSEVPF